MAPFNRTIWSHLPKWFGIPTISPHEAREEEEGRPTATTCHQGAWPPAHGAGRPERPSPFPRGSGSSFWRSLLNAHTSATHPHALGTGFCPKPWHQKGAEVHTCPVLEFPPASCRGPCWGGSPHPPSDCSFLPHCWASALGRWLTSRGSQSCLIPSSRKQFVARSDGWRVPLKHQETDVWALGFGWHTGLRRPALGEGARQNFIVSGGTTSARDERQHFRSPG